MADASGTALATKAEADAYANQKFIESGNYEYAVKGEAAMIGCAAGGCVPTFAGMAVVETQGQIFQESWENDVVAVVDPDGDNVDAVAMSEEGEVGLKFIDGADVDESDTNTDLDSDGNQGSESDTVDGAGDGSVSGTDMDVEPDVDVDSVDVSPDIDIDIDI